MDLSPLIRQTISYICIFNYLYVYLVNLRLTIYLKRGISMAYIDSLTEAEVTLRDFKTVLNRLMTNYDPNHPVTITINESGQSRTFSLVPKRTRRRSNGEAFAIKDIPFETLEDPKEPGTYIAIDTFNIAENTPIPFVYGLYVDFDGVRDLRFFNDRESCEKWLSKKIKLLEK